MSKPLNKFEVFMTGPKYALMFLAVAFSKNGLFSKTGRILMWGKIRRIFICMVPGLPEKLRKKHNIQGGCAGCGVSCQLMFKCPAYNIEQRNCNVYQYRPTVCREFPITPADIRDRELVAASGVGCGFWIGEENLPEQQSPAQNPAKAA